MSVQIALHFSCCGKIGCATDSMNSLHTHNNIRRLRCVHMTQNPTKCIFLQFVAAIDTRHLTLTLHLFSTRSLRINFILLKPKLKFPRTLRHSVPPLHAFIMFSTLIFYAKNNHVRWTFACKNYVLIKRSIADSNSECKMHTIMWPSTHTHKRNALAR